MDEISNARVYKKTSANSILTLYLGSRDLYSNIGVVEPLCGVIYIDPKFMCTQKIYGQITLTFRYGREDEEVMGLKFCNEAVISLKQIWPRANYNDAHINPLQSALVERLGNGAYPFSLDVGMLAPPSVQLLPAKNYSGSPIGTSYDVRIFMSDSSDEKFQRRTTIKLGIRLLHKIPSDLRPIQQTNPTYTSLPKCIKLRLSPKQINFHSTGNSKNSNSTPIDFLSMDTAKALGTSEIDNHKTEKLSFTDHFDAFKVSSFAQTTPAITSGVVNVDTHPLTLSASENQRLSFTDVKKKSIDHNEDGNKMISDAVAKTNIPKGPEGSVDKPFLWTEGRVSLRASLNKVAYKHGEPIFVQVNIRNNSRKIIRKIRVFAVQHVDVCMFSNGKFKNVVADINEVHQIRPDDCFNQMYEFIPKKGATKNWIAVETSFTNTINTTNTFCPENDETMYKIAASAHRGVATAVGEDRNVFAIYVSYYVKVKLTLSGMGGEVSLKLPFVLGHVDDGDYLNGFSTSSNTSIELNDKRRDGIQCEQSTSQYISPENDDNSLNGQMKDMAKANPTKIKHSSDISNEDSIIIEEQQESTSKLVPETKTMQKPHKKIQQECDDGSFYELISNIRRKSSNNEQHNGDILLTENNSMMKRPSNELFENVVDAVDLSKTYQKKLSIDYGTEIVQSITDIDNTITIHPIKEENIVLNSNSVTVIVHRSKDDEN